LAEHAELEQPGSAIDGRHRAQIRDERHDVRLGPPRIILTRHEADGRAVAANAVLQQTRELRVVVGREDPVLSARDVRRLITTERAHLLDLAALEVLAVAREAAAESAREVL